MTEDPPDELESGLRRRDGRFIWRLVMLLLIAILASVWLAGRLTKDEVGGCAARGFFDVTEPGSSAGQGEPQAP